MNLPNKLTILRLILVFVFAIFAFPIPGAISFMSGFARALAALICYILASVTDSLDGYLARKNNQITDFGKFLDPIADKLLVTAALLSLACYSGYYVWAALIILAREFVVSGIRMVAASKGVVIAAGKLGKLKMIFQSIALSILLGANVFSGLFRKILFIGGNVFLVIAVVLTIWSGVDYIVKNSKLIKME